MRVVCYFDELVSFRQFKDNKDLLHLWEKSWKNNGWEPVVLNKTQANVRCEILNIDLSNYSSNLYKYSLFNPEYQRACFSRWFAYYDFAQATEKNIMWADFDVINYGFSVQDLFSLNDENDIQPFNASFCCGFSGSSGLRKVVDALISVYRNNDLARSLADVAYHLAIKKKTPHKKSTEDEPPKSYHFSDMTFISNLAFPFENYRRAPKNNIKLCVNANLSEMKELLASPLIHYHGGAFTGYKNESSYRVEMIQSIRPIN